MQLTSADDDDADKDDKDDNDDDDDEDADWAPAEEAKPKRRAIEVISFMLN